MVDQFKKIQCLFRKNKHHKSFLKIKSHYTISNQTHKIWRHHLMVMGLWFNKDSTWFWNNNHQIQLKREFFWNSLFQLMQVKEKDGSKWKNHNLLMWISWMMITHVFTHFALCKLMVLWIKVVHQQNRLLPCHYNNLQQTFHQISWHWIFFIRPRTKINISLILHQLHHWISTFNSNLRLKKLHYHWQHIFFFNSAFLDHW